MNLPFEFHSHMSESLGNLALIGILKINSALWGRNVFFTFPTSQPLLSTSTKLDTFSNPEWVPIGIVTLKDSGDGSHLSFQILTPSPFPIHHLAPLSTTFFEFHMLLHA